MNKKILYLGDTLLTEAGAYLAGIMNFYGIGFDYLASDKRFGDQLVADESYAAVIISDYPAANFSSRQLERLADNVRSGQGLLMIGGWDSFSGVDGKYTDTILAEVLPVIMQTGDDRVNCPQPCLIEKRCDHPIIGTLPFEANPPGIGGFNSFEAKPEAVVVLCSRRFEVSCGSGEFRFSPAEQSNPLLVTGSYGKGRTCAFATDVAPHWVGGFVDWGSERVKSQAAGSVEIDVGSYYARFFANMVNWTAAVL